MGWPGKSDATTMAKGKFRIAVVDDQLACRRGLAQMIGSWPHGTVVLQADNGVEYEKACLTEARIHIALVHLDLPVRNGFETLLEIKRRQERTMAVAIAYKPTEEQVAKALRCYACAILCTTITEEELHKALNSLARTGFYRCDRIKEHLARPPVEAPTPEERIAKLTKREHEFLLHYATEPHPKLKEIAQKMGRNCVESLRKQVCKRIGCKRQPEMIVFVRENWEALMNRGWED